MSIVIRVTTSRDRSIDTAIAVASNIKKRASVLASACDTTDETEDGEGEIEEDLGLSHSTFDTLTKRQRKSNPMFSQGFVPINALDEYDEELNT